MKSFFNDYILQNREATLAAFSKVTPENIGYRLTPEAASVGFLYRHMGETIHGLLRILGVEMDFKPIAIRVETDDNLCTDIDATRSIIESGFDKLLAVANSMPDNEWDVEIDTFLGKMTKAVFLGRILSHNNYHLGQAQLTVKRGK